MRWTAGAAAAPVLSPPGEIAVTGLQVCPSEAASAHSAGPRRRRWATPARDAGLIGAAYAVYTWVRDAVRGDQLRAVDRGWSILAREHAVHLDPEHALNRLLAGHAQAATAAGYYYAVLHFAVVIGVLSWLYRRHPRHAGALAGAWYGMNLLALVGFWLFPLAPPRLLPHSGFVDTIVRFHTWGSWGTQSVAASSNQYAAMPSLHVGWALWCAIAIAVVARPRWVRVAAFGYPVMTLVVVLATANHYLLDAVAGAAVCGLGFVLHRGAALITGRAVAGSSLRVQPGARRAARSERR